MHYRPTTWPGARLPHVWLDDGSALYDRLGKWYALLRLGGTNADTTPLEQAFQKHGAPLEVFNLPDAAVRKTYGHDSLLVRPDLHVVWRGNDAPPDAMKLAALATGHGSRKIRPSSSLPSFPRAIWEVLSEPAWRATVRRFGRP